MHRKAYVVMPDFWLETMGKKDACPGTWKANWQREAILLGPAV